MAASNEITTSDVNVESLAQTLMLTEQYLSKSYLNDLSSASALNLPTEIADKIKLGSNIRLLELEAVLLDKDSSLDSKIKNLMGAVETFDAGLMLIVNAKGDRVKIYIGISADDIEVITPAFNTFLSSLSGILPGCRFKNLKQSKIIEIFTDIFPAISQVNYGHSIASVTAFPAIRKGDNDAAVNGKNSAHIDALIDGMHGKPFTMVILNRAVKNEDIAYVQNYIEALYTQLSPYERIQITKSDSDSDSISLNYSHSLNKNKSYSTGITRSESHTTGTSHNVSSVEYDQEAAKKLAGIGLLSAALAIGSGASFAKKLNEPFNAPQNLFYSSGIAGIINNILTYKGVDLKPHDKTISDGSNISYTASDSRQVTISASDGITDSQGYTIGNSKTFGTSNQLSFTNKTVSRVMSELDTELESLNNLRREGAFLSAAYFIAGDNQTAITAANFYRAITQSFGTAAMLSPINHWEDNAALKNITDYLCRGLHPNFALSDSMPTVVDAAQIIGISDTPSYISLPERSVPGYIVSERAEFSRDIISDRVSNSSNDDYVNIGCIYHLGRAETQTPINLYINDLTKHLFVTGATGVGKSNFCYQLLDGLLKKDIKVLVVEPAKGEYAGVLGGRPGFNVYGVNPRLSPVLRINPFAFPDGISVIQHVERLLDIFNAAWPMYSAMPAILKEAIEKIYSDRGFDFIYGEKPADAEFPSFSDLLDVLPKIIADTDYSKEVQGNYIGALVTRVKSLTNGIYGLIFNKDEVGDQALFDENTIIDISRVGSSETKALIMGIVTMRLNEYRMCSGRVNSPLKHVTLLEEAHNLLKGNTSGSPEGVNVREASVEMITNSIAEMRTYGEGFIIADQSPSVLDPSVIRNTQTKVAFMLPDRADREAIGGSLSLSDEQEQDIARLSVGVAAVYQNGWTSAVLCKINRFADEKITPFKYDGYKAVDNRRSIISYAVSAVLSKHESCSKPNSDRIRELLGSGCQLYDKSSMIAIEVLKAYIECKELPKSEKTIISELIPLEKIILESGVPKDSESIKIWNADVATKLLNYVDLNDQELFMLISLGIHYFSTAEVSERQRFKILYIAHCKPEEK